MTRTDSELRVRRVLVAGASGGIGMALLGLLSGERAWIGAHGRRRVAALETRAARAKGASRMRAFTGDLSTQEGCRALVDAFAEWAGGIDGLVQLTGHVRRPAPPGEVSELEWNEDLAVNLSGPFFLVQRAMALMGPKGGRIVLSSTASARHGGGRTSLAYGAAKAGVECLVKGLAREGAARNILVNAVAPGFIATDFHTRVMGRTLGELKRRAEMVPLKRPGAPADAARMVVHLLSAGGDYITGETIPISGGDWL